MIALAKTVQIKHLTQKKYIVMITKTYKPICRDRIKGHCENRSHKLGNPFHIYQLAAVCSTFICSFKKCRQVTGKPNCASDVDIGILLHTNDQAIQIERRNQYMVDLANILRKEIHPVIFNSAGEELMCRIFSTGKCILVKDEKQLSLFKMIMYARIADYGYCTDSMKSGLITKIMES